MFIWHFLVYWGLPQQKGFSKQKNSHTHKKINSATVKKWNCHRRSCKQSETYLGITGEWSTQEREKLDCPRNPLLPFLRRYVSGRGPSTPTQQAIIFQDSHLDMWLLSSHLRSSPATVSWDVYGIGMISEDGSAWMISCLDLAGTFFHLF